MTKDNVGIIIPKAVYDKMPELTGNVLNMFSVWEETAERHNLALCFFRFFDIQPKEKMLKAYVKENGRYIVKQVSSPKVIYSRVLDNLPTFREHIESLFENGKIIFNVPNYDVHKYTIHEILEKDSYLRKHLPETKLFSIHSLNEMASRYHQLILKKNYGEFGIGAMKLEKVDGQWCLSYKDKGNEKLKQVFFTKKLPSVLQKRIRRHNYIIQEIIPLATYEGNPFDMRVAIQKNRQGEFQVSAIMCKVAGNQEFLTNGAQGGTTYTFEEVAPNSHPSMSFNHLVEEISRFSLYAADVLDDYFPSIADLGFDMGITKEGTPYFIECNFISDYETGLFREGQLIKDDWKSVFTTPIDYAKYLMDRYY